MIFLNLYILVLLIGGIIALVKDVRHDYKENPLPTWDTRWIEFLLILWWILSAGLMSQGISLSIIDHIYSNNAPTAIVALVIGTTSHVASLIAIVLCFKYFKIGEKLQLNIHKLSVSNYFSSIIKFLFSSILLTILVGNGWEATLQFLHKLNLAPIYQAQDLVSIFENNGHIGIHIALIFMAVVIAPISEELLFRGLIYRFLKGRWGARNALIISSLLFACLHFNILSFLPLFLLGLLLCRAYEKSGSIYVSIGFHALFNANNILLLLLQSYLM